MGLLPMLDEEGRIVGGSDEGFLNKIRRTHKDNKRLKWKGKERERSYCLFHCLYITVQSYIYKTFSFLQ